MALKAWSCRYRQESSAASQVDYIRNTFLLDELDRLQTFMENNQDLRITFEDKIKDWPRTDVLDLLKKYEAMDL